MNEERMNLYSRIQWFIRELTYIQDVDHDGVSVLTIDELNALVGMVNRLETVIDEENFVDAEEKVGTGVDEAPNRA